jgi:hypothetical protein
MEQPYSSHEIESWLEELARDEAKRRWATAKKIGELRPSDPRLLAQLELMAQNDPVKYVRDEARQAVRRLAPAAVSNAYVERLVDIIREHGDDQPRQAALAELRRLGWVEEL